MFKLLSLCILLSAIYCDDTFIKAIIDKSIKYSANNGMQLLLIDNTQSKFFCSLVAIKPKSIMEVDCHLLLTDSKDDIDKKNGAWASIGFGSNTMFNSDMITFHYWTIGDKKSMSADCWNDSSVRYVKLDTDFDKSTGKNHVTEKLFTADSINISGYKTHLNWKAEKSLENLDPFDWKDIVNWETNNGSVIGAWGYNAKTGEMTQHINPARPKAYSLVDGQGLNLDLSGDTGPITSETSNANIYLSLNMALFALLVSLIF